MSQGLIILKFILRIIILRITYRHNIPYFCIVSIVIPRIINFGPGPIVKDAFVIRPVPIHNDQVAIIRDTNNIFMT